MSYFNEDKLAERIAFHGLTPDIRQIIKDNKALLSACLPQAIDRLYDHILQFKSVAKFFKDEALIHHAKKRQAVHFDLLLAADFNEDYLTSVTKIGEVHYRIGLEPNWYISSYSYLADYVTAQIGPAKDEAKTMAMSEYHRITSLRNALICLCSFDMSCALDVYWGVKLIYLD